MNTAKKSIFEKLILIGISIALIGCTTLKSDNGGNISQPIASQKLATSFVNEKIKIETKCALFGLSSDCKIVAIESTATAPTFGNTVNNRKNALTVAEMRANSNVSEFLNKEITTSRVNNTIAKNIEKASDIMKKGTSDGSTVELTDKEATNISLRENKNETVVQLTETIRTSSMAILKGFVKIKEEVVGDQEVSVTIRWDLENEMARNQLLNKMK